jgi:hypothetical protein
MKEVNEGDWIKYPNVYLKENDFNILTLWDDSGHRIDRRINNPLNNKEFWWFIGLWLGDGWCSGKHDVSVIFNRKETEYISRF